MKPLNVDHIVLEVRDVDQSLHFYCDLLGMTPERVDLFKSGRAPFPSVRCGDTLIDLFVSEAPGDGPPHFCVSFAEPIEEIAAQLANAGIRAGEPAKRYGARGIGKSVYVDDPDGHTIELRSYVKIDGP